MKYEHVDGQERKQMRWSEYDYSTQGVYFVTIVTLHRLCLFGNVVNNEMKLNDPGKMILEEYHALENDMVNCLDVVVMPNHIHFMINIMEHDSSSLPVILKNFKSKTTMLYGRGVKEKEWRPYDQHLWQRSYWDDVVWNARMFEFIRRYIHLNPQRWGKDLLNDNHDYEVDDINGCLKKLKQ